MGRPGTTKRGYVFAYHKASQYIYFLAYAEPDAMSYLKGKHTAPEVLVTPEIIKDLTRRGYWMESWLRRELSEYMVMITPHNDRFGVQTRLRALVEAQAAATPTAAA